MFVKISACPNCKKPLKLEVNEPDDHRLGEPSETLCPHCMTLIGNGRTEWTNKSSYEKGVFVFRCVLTVTWMSVMILFASILLIGFFPIIDEILNMKGKLSSIPFIIYSILVVSAVSYHVYKWARETVNDSLKRTAPPKKNKKPKHNMFNYPNSK